MRVALLAPLFESVPPKLYGGTERVIWNLIRGVAGSGIEVTLFGTGDSMANCKMVPIVEEALRLRHIPVAESFPFHMKMLSDVAKVADEFDLIHNHHDLWMLPLSKMSRTPILTTLHGRLDLPGFASGYEAYSTNCEYVSISDSQREPVPRIPWLRTIYHGIDCEAFEFKPKMGKYLAFLGRINPEKKPEWAIEIAKKSGIPLKIAAKIEGPEGRAYYDHFVRPHVDGKFVEYVGEITEDEKAAFLGDALALTFPIDWPEPFGLVMIESLACGTPVLARPCGSVHEILRDGVTGFISMDISKLAEGATQISKIDRHACRQWVKERFSLRRMTEEYIDVYRSVAARTSQRARTDRHRRDFLSPVQRPSDRDSEDQLQRQFVVRSSRRPR